MLFRSFYDELGHWIGVVTFAAPQNVGSSSLALSFINKACVLAEGKEIPLSKSQQAKWYGIGVRLQKIKTKLVVAEVFEDLAAYKAGMKVGDFIMKIDNDDVQNLSLNQAVEKLRGAIGTNVILSLSRGEDSALREVSIEREEIVLGQESGLYAGLDNYIYKNGLGGQSNISILVERLGNSVSVSLRTANGRVGEGIGKISEKTVKSIKLKIAQDTVCPTELDAALVFSDSHMTWSYTAKDCNGEFEGKGQATRVKS